MKSVVSRCGLAWLTWLCFSDLTVAEGEPAFQRVANTTIRLPAQPPRAAYALTDAFGNLTFHSPVAVTTPPGETNRLFVVEQTGRILVLTNLANPTPSIFLDLTGRVTAGGERGCLGLAFHPGYATNRQFYVFYTLTTTTSGGTGLHDRLSRFLTALSDPSRALPDSEQPLITQFDQFDDRNGGDLHFGPDGFLYVSLGDEGGPNDAGGNSQRINGDFFSGILRLDVDRRPGNQPPTAHPAVHRNTYAIPADNPFLGLAEFNGQAINPASLRAEFFAIGLRHPWRFSFDPETGRLWCGDVGSDFREEINLVVRGGNYGWAVREGTVNGPRALQAPPEFRSRPPLHQYRHGPGPEEGNAVVGGVVYRGTRYPSLTGAYVFGDAVSGHLWALRTDGTNVTSFEHLGTNPGVAAFGTDPRQGDVLVVNHADGHIRRLGRGTAPSPSFPGTLAETGAFSDLAKLTPAPGVVPYAVNVPAWAGGAESWRWFSIPDPRVAMEFQRDGPWTYPPGMIWLQHFSLELTNGAPRSARRLETRVLVRSTNGAYGLTYRWDDSQTNATLVPDEGLKESFRVHDGGVVRTQVWHYPGRSECVACHSAANGWAAGFHTTQLNRPTDLGHGPIHQLQAWSDAGYFTTPLTNRHTLRQLVPLTDTNASTEFRVRSYIAANCASCHQPGRPDAGLFDARATTPLREAGWIRGPLLENGGNLDLRVMVPGWPPLSMLLERLSNHRPGAGLAAANPRADTNAIQFLTDWIRWDAFAARSFLEWQADIFFEPDLPEAAALADPDRDGAVNYLEYLVGTSPVLSVNPWRVAIQHADGAVKIGFRQIANRGFEVQVTTNLLDPTAWQPLDAPGNAPYFIATDRETTIEDPNTNSPACYFRVRVFEP